jgi:hypothetical protein
MRPRAAGLRRVAVEQVVVAEAWHASNELPPVLQGQVSTMSAAATATAFYELQVWAWDDPSGTFADHNPRVSCETCAPAQ